VSIDYSLDGFIVLNDEQKNNIVKCENIFSKNLSITGTNISLIPG
jgi:hypothetical protein